MWGRNNAGDKADQMATARTFMGALARDVRGNTLAIMAAALIPLAGLVGGGIDISRMYITKTRLQHACDAGALAGRKSMGGGVWGTDDNAVAQKFFDANFQNDRPRTPAPMAAARSRLHGKRGKSLGQRIGHSADDPDAYTR